MPTNKNGRNHFVDISLLVVKLCERNCTWKHGFYFEGRTTSYSAVFLPFSSPGQPFSDISTCIRPHVPVCSVTFAVLMFPLVSTGGEKWKIL